ncbi:MAG: hypothetical protein LZ172_08050 [Thaumarchaeota archaeon]|nr:hypothetical protein [Candidatus Geocrenenecus arthurdayi]MCL7391643.1 hypothetical protein [Candidatus Geocrenenecus arthurdayi]MCL7404278.1 hypothetical protein [Candidatus Geocrenenecus arthurdayi]
MSSKLKGLLSTVNMLGFGIALREGIRHISGLSYNWRGIQVDSTNSFMFLRKPVSSQCEVYGLQRDRS